ncbi:MAG TPA: DUF1890 domain-containing protein [Methanothermobacter sp.]|jgi:hypothetical protein|uniref:DUF1890 domain-containing protein n=1 Tax=Methanothermobacter tenebrarum TaxID=680118 RepID=A0ABM7YD99_9EURY|nr:DUF1890 domain-containing protein [Methanothermobacter tenebrarum]MDI6882761.1 DUF1890 domain-containing protein [Methanothermobacter sp.]MDX9692607.1 DUF1890 domain-containing protein [Methanothermobacter sp.]BDH79232.1 hypothetical protein MTTB_06110 [Methanothermobacter tenebrarum]HHW16244.1 DUF1890 domain-containing protein [Methanothermobacter sp.]HOQ20643.1 DUF1890 domain-containing protein [Methanothermobacter sp.]
MKKVLILLGCPESPIQAPITLYLSYKLREKDYRVTVTANPAALRLLEVADPARAYLDKTSDLDSTIDSLSKAEYDLLFGFIHNDAALTYFITFKSILEVPSIAIIFGRDAEIIDTLEKEVKENTDSHIVSVRAHHNPNPLKVRIDKLLEELED